MNLDEVEQYEESSDDDDEYDNKVARTIGAKRQTAWKTYEENSTG